MSLTALLHDLDVINYIPTELAWNEEADTSITC